MVTNYKEMPVGMFTDYMKIVNKYTKDEELTEEEQIQLQVDILVLLTGMTEDDILNMPLPKLTILNRGCQFLKEKVKTFPMRSKYKVGGFVLQPCKNIDHWTTSQYVDYQSLLKAEDTAGLLACMLLPRGKTYGNGYDVMEVKEAIGKDLSIEDAMSVTAFFLQKYASSMRSLITSSVREAVMMIPTWKGKMDFVKKVRMVTNSLKSGDGLQTLKRSQNSQEKTGMQSKK